MPFLDLSGISLSYAQLNPATMILLFYGEVFRIYRLDTNDYAMVWPFLVIAANLIVWFPLSHYVIIPLLNRVFYPVRRRYRGA